MKPPSVSIAALSVVLALTGCSSASAPNQTEGVELPHIVSVGSSEKHFSLDAIVTGTVAIKNGCFVLESDRDSSDTDIWPIMWTTGAERSADDPQAVRVGEFEIRAGDTIRAGGGWVTNNGDLPEDFAACKVSDPAGYVQVGYIQEVVPGH